MIIYGNFAMPSTIIKTVQELAEWFINSGTTIALDTEATSLNYFDLQILGVSLSDGINTGYIDLYENPQFADILGVLNNWLHTLDLIIFHNASYDLKVLAKYAINLEDINIFDTMIASHLLDENTPCGLKYLATAFLNIPHQSIMKFPDAMKNGFHGQEFYDYAMCDALWTYKLYKIFKPRLTAENLDSLFYNIEMPFVHCLVDMERYGVLIDRNKLRELKSKIYEQIKSLQIEMCQIAKLDFVLQSHLFDGEQEVITEIDFDSPQQLSKLLRNLGLNLGKPNANGHCSVDKAALKKHKDNQFIKVLIEYRKATALRDKFIEKMPQHIDKDGRVRTSFRNTLVTGRLSSSDPNLQNISRDNTGPLKVRECFIPKPGYSFIVADFSGQELRVTAVESQDLTMMQAFYNNEDLHQKVADECGISRDVAKTINFGIIYGMTNVGLAKRLGITEVEAQKFIGGYFEKFPGIKQAIDRTNRELNTQGYVTGLYGRCRRFPYYKYANNYDKARCNRQAFNFKVQGPSAEIMKLGAIAVRKLLKRVPEWDCKLVLCVHDEYIWEIKSDWAHIVIPIIKEEIERAIQLPIPIIVDISYGSNYSEAKP